METVTATKTQILEKHLKEFDRVINYLQSLKTYCNQMLLEEEQEELGYCGECMNDPQNIPRKPREASIKSSDVIFKTLVQKSECEMRENNHFIATTESSHLLKEILKGCNNLTFPVNFFPENSKKKNYKCYDVEETLLTMLPEDAIEMFTKILRDC